jgi:hypothetical protein
MGAGTVPNMESPADIEEAGVVEPDACASGATSDTT